MTSTTIVVACAVLHNLSLIVNDVLEEDEEADNADIYEDIPENGLLPWQPGEGFIVREALIERLFR